MKLVISVLLILSIAGLFIINRAQPNKEPARTSADLTYLPLGDSYTIGQSVAEAERWPNQLVAALALDNKQLEIVGNPSRTGYTTQDLIERELPVLHAKKPMIVSLQIGVNDWVQGVDSATFQKNLRFIIDDIQATLPDKSKLVLVTIPDFGKTPAGSGFGDPKTIEAGLAEFNKIIVDEATTRNLPVADVFIISQAAATDPSLVANDGLHPSGKQYTTWVEQILPAFRKILN